MYMYMYIHVHVCRIYMYCQQPNLTTCRPNKVLGKTKPLPYTHREAVAQALGKAPHRGTHTHTHTHTHTQLSYGMEEE